MATVFLVPVFKRVNIHVENSFYKRKKTFSRNNNNIEQKTDFQ